MGQETQQQKKAQKREILAYVKAESVYGAGKPNPLPFGFLVIAEKHS